MQNVMFLVIISDLNIETKFDASGVRRISSLIIFNSVVLPVGFVSNDLPHVRLS